MDRPNILLITDDQHRFDWMRSEAVPGLATPALDRLRAEGSVLERAYSNCPICMPTRHTWLTGLYASQVAARLMRNAHSWPMHHPTFAQALRRAGYRTALVGKLHSHAGLHRYDLADEDARTRARGFDEVVEVSGKSLSNWYDCAWTRYLESRGLLETYRRDLAWRLHQTGGDEQYAPSPLAPEDTMDGFIGGEAGRMLDALAGGDAPWMLHASFCGPHFPYDPPEPHFSRHKSEDMPPPVGLDDAEAVRWWREIRCCYAGLVELVDDQVAALLAALDARGLAERTLVLFTTDHGDLLGDFGWREKSRPQDVSSRTPIFVRMPGTVPAGRSLGAMAEAADLPATLLEAAGLGSDVEDHLPQSPGRSFWGYVRGEAEGHRDWAYSECGDVDRGWRMAVEARYKYVHRTGGEALYDLAADPTELRNLAGEPAAAEHLGRLRERLIRSMLHCRAQNTEPREGGSLR